MPCSLPEHGASTSTFAKATTTDSWLPCLHSPRIHAICGRGVAPPHIRLRVIRGQPLLKHSRTCGLELSRESLHFLRHPAPQGGGAPPRNALDGPFTCGSVHQSLLQALWQLYRIGRNELIGVDDATCGSRSGWGRRTRGRRAREGRSSGDPARAARSQGPLSRAAERPE
jgi:hypothetical protein